LIIYEHALLKLVTSCTHVTHVTHVYINPWWPDTWPLLH